MANSEPSRIFKTHCVMCSDACGLNVHVKDGKIIKIEGNKEHPANHLCSKGKTLIDYVYSPDRLRYPMKKVNGSFKKISWDEALDFVSAKLINIKKKYGAHSLVVYVGMPGVLDLELTAFAQRFRTVFGTPNLLSVESMCFRSRIFSRQVTFGTYPIQEPNKANCIILWGQNPANSWPGLEQIIRKGIEERGCKLIVIDPRRIPLAEEGIHLQPRPGTDGAIALAMINVIINEELYDKEFTEKWTYGFDKLKEHIQQYTPEWAEGISWVPASDIRNVSRIFAGSTSCILQGQNTQDQKIGGVQTNRSFSILQSITGNIGKPGTWRPVPYIRTTDLRVPLEERPLGYDVYPLYDSLWKRLAPFGQGMLLPEALETGKPYPIRGLICDASNMAVTFPNSRRLLDSLKKLELFVVMDVFMNETATYADVVLPASTFLERVGLGYIYGVVSGWSYVMKRQKVIDPLPESWPDWKIWAELGKKCGYAEYFPWNNDEEVLEYLMKESQVSYQQLLDNPNGLWFGEPLYRWYEKKGFGTPSGKIEIYSNTLKEAGYPPLPTYIEPAESPYSKPEFAKEFPLILITGARQLEYIHSQGRNIVPLRKDAPFPELEMHPSVAEKYRVSQGEMVWLETKRGRIKVEAKITENIMPKVLSLPHGWAIANENLLTDIGNRDPISGFPELKPLLCRISKVD